MKNLAIKKIETAEDMVNWAKAINNNPMSIQDKCDFQDIWARSDRNTLDRLFIEWNTRQTLVMAQEKTLLESKKTYWKRITDLKRKVNNLTFDKERMQKDLDHCWEKNNRLLNEMAELRAKAAKYDTIRAAIA